VQWKAWDAGFILVLVAIILVVNSNWSHQTSTPASCMSVKVWLDLSFFSSVSRRGRCHCEYVCQMALWVSGSGRPSIGSFTTGVKGVVARLTWCTPLWLPSSILATIYLSLNTIQTCALLRRSQKQEFQSYTPPLSAWHSISLSRTLICGFSRPSELLYKCSGNYIIHSKQPGDQIDS
jgi:hypothetical protein